jgi:hypothetical protein
MLKLEIVRGTADLPRDIEQQFFKANGREMNREEREFFRLPSPNRKKDRQPLHYKPQPKAA